MGFLKIKVIKKKFKNGRRKKKGKNKKENSTELQKPNIEEADIYNNNRKCD